MTDRLAPVRAESAGSIGPIAAMRNPAEKKTAQRMARARPGCAGAGAGARRRSCRGPEDGVVDALPQRAHRVSAGPGGDAVGEQHDVGVARVVDPQRRAGEAGVADGASGS